MKSAHRSTSRCTQGVRTAGAASVRLRDAAAGGGRRAVADAAFVSLYGCARRYRRGHLPNARAVGLSVGLRNHDHSCERRLAGSKRRVRRGVGRRARKVRGDLFAAIGFQFVVWAASYIGSFVGALGLILGVVAALFLIYTIPAASIGGIPGTLALSRSVRAVRSAPIASLIFALVFFVIWYVAVPMGLPYLLIRLRRDLELRYRRSAHDRAGLSRLSVCQAVRRRRVSRLLVSATPR